MRQITFLFIITMLVSCKTALHETQVAEKLLHDLEEFETQVMKDIEEPPGCAENC